MTTKCGFVAVVGAPNAGKSTFVNRCLGTKISIVSPKVQTTRVRVRGIGMIEKSQIIFVDTPGIFAPKRRLERAIVSEAWSGAADADLILVLVDVSEKKKSVNMIISTLKDQGRKAVLVLNKIDKVSREQLIAKTVELNETGIFTDTFMISAEKGDGVQDLFHYLAEHMPEGPYHYPEDQISDMPMRLLAAEITREKLFRSLHAELPYGLTVETETWKEKEDGSVRVEQTIYIAREAHKKIILGKGGSKIKHIGAKAREELQELLEMKVHLFLFVKVRENWENDKERYTAWGLDFHA